jgi:hypothetical protein
MDHLPTVASTQAAGYVVVLVWCKGCHHQKVADLAALIGEGRPCKNRAPCLQ